MTNDQLPADLREHFARARPVDEVLAEWEGLRDHPETDPAHVAARLRGDVVEWLLHAMQQQGVTQSELARRVGKSRQWVSRILNESDNFTLETIARLACALGLRADVRLVLPRASAPAREPLVAEDPASYGPPTPR